MGRKSISALAVDTRNLNPHMCQHKADVSNTFERAVCSLKRSNLTVNVAWHTKYVNQISVLEI